MKESDLVSRILLALRARPSDRSGLLVGPGDDAAVLPATPHADWVVSCDWFLENVHFLPGVHPPDSVGFKALARAASDLGAMGATPRFYFLSLAMPSPRTGKWLDRMLAGMARAARRFHLELAGGDTTRRSSVAIHITVIGHSLRGRTISRRGARSGDKLFVSGTLGAAQLGLEFVRRKLSRRLLAKNVMQAHLYPEPPLELGCWLAKHRLASAMIDLSDGLSTDLHRLCRASGAGARIDRSSIPSAAIPAALSRTGLKSERVALHGGDDYQLLFAVPRRLTARIPARFKGRPLTCIGEITRVKSVLLVDKEGHASPLRPAGWDPFRKKK
jgi:thiamine-monophosphate kinase